VAVTSWLIDKSAYVRMQSGQTAEIDAWNSRIERGLVRLSTITRLELGSSARSGEAGRAAFGVPPLSMMPVERLTPATEDRAFAVQMLLADAGSIVPVDPGSADRGDRGVRLTVLAVDEDVDLIAEITGQSVQILAAR